VNFNAEIMVPLLQKCDAGRARPYVCGQSVIKCQ